VSNGKHDQSGSVTMSLVVDVQWAGVRGSCPVDSRGRAEGFGGNRLLGDWANDSGRGVRPGRENYLHYVG
jgi:hypothetical protein